MQGNQPEEDRGYERRWLVHLVAPSLSVPLHEQGRRIRIERMSIQPSRPQQVQFGIQRRHPTLKHYPTRARYRGAIAIPRRCGGVGGQGDVGAVVDDEFLEVGQQDHFPFAPRGA